MWQSGGILPMMPNDARLTTNDLTRMVSHWLGCPPNGYLGQSYGSDVKAILQSPMASGLADGLIAKCRQDIPLLGLAQPGTLNVYSYDVDIDKKAIVSAVYLGIGVPATNPIPPTQWSYNKAVKDDAFNPAEAKKLLGV